ncbi:MAG: APC family permease [Clostridiaceae bacterium]|nr:APC family permease [Clostridiaceae bacterium]
MSSNSAPAVSAPIVPKRKGDGKLGLLELYCISIGQVIGAGVITLVGPAIAKTGWSAWLCYGLAVLYGFIIVIPLIFITGTVKLSGGYYSLIAGFTQSKRITGMFAVAQLTKMFSISLFAVSLGTYIKSLFPSIQGITFMEAAFMSFFFIINMFGIDMMAKVQKYMTYLLIAVLFMFGVWGLAHYNNPIFDFSHPNFITNGVFGMWVATLSLEYSTTGYSMTMNYGAVARNATRDIPRALLLSAPTILILYCGVAMADTCVLPIAEVINRPLTYTALAIFPKVLFYLFIVGGPIMALLTTLNSTIPANSLAIVKACEDGWMPKSLAQRNKYGVAWKINCIYWIIGLIPLLLNFSVSVITDNIQLLNSLLAIIYIYSYWFLPKRFPEAWKNSRYHIPDNLYRFSVIVCFVLQMIVLITKTVTMSSTIVITSTIVTLVLFAIGFIRARDSSIDMSKIVKIWAD